MHQELDYRNEANNLQEFYDHKTNLIPLFDIPLKTRVPKVYPEFSSDRIITMEFLEGMTLNQLIKLYQNGTEAEIAAVEAQGYDRAIIARQISLLMMKQAFLDGYFNGDPHPANIIVNAKNEVMFIDFGLVGRIDHKTRTANLKFFRALAILDEDSAYRAVVKLLDVSQVEDPTKLRQAVAKMVAVVREVRAELDSTYARNSQAALFNLLNVLYQQKIQISPDVAKALRAMATVDGIVSTLVPEMTTSEAVQDVYKITLAAAYLNLLETFKGKNFTRLTIKLIDMFEDFAVLS